MRIVAGFLFLWHGTQKLSGAPMPPPQVPSFVIAMAGPIELIGGTLVGSPAQLGFTRGHAGSWGMYYPRWDSVAPAAGIEAGLSPPTRFMEEPKKERKTGHVSNVK